MRFDLIGYNSENLVKTLHRKNIKIKNLEKTSFNKLSFEVEDKDAKKAKKYIHNFKITCSLSKLKQIPIFFLAHIGIIIGILIASVCFGIVKNFVWQIEIFGLEELSKQEILSVLKDNEVAVGKQNKQSSQDIEEILLNKYDRIAQVSVIKQGCAIIINLSEKLVYNEQSFLPIKAKYAGIIKKINIITGTVNAKVGDYVNAGEILVFPYNINSNGEKVGVEPVAEIQAEMFVVAKCEIQKTEMVLRRTGNKQICYQYKFNNNNLFCGKNKNSFALFETEVYNESINGVLPLYRDVLTYYELEHVEIQHDFESELTQIEQKSKDMAKQQVMVGEILKEETKTTINENRMCCCTILTVLGIINA